ncbi:MAG: glycosyltransferase family 4 protein [Candidatus Sericytochromatia bacterium]|nr:glycosyltransferase family 4 protein [Candidatus Sericytochromatia bacterium]
MKLAFICDGEQDDQLHWSGTIWQLSQALKAQGAELLHLNIKDYLAEGIYRSITTTPYVSADSLWHAISPTCLQWLARCLEKKLAQHRPDAVLSHGAFGLAYLQTDLPCFYWEDMPSVLLTQTYPRYRDSDPLILKSWEQAEQLAFLNVRHLFFPSDWSSQTACRHYELDAARISVLPFGANLNPTPDAETLQTLWQQRQTKSWQMLFIGKDWERKGGPCVLEMLQHLNQAGLKIQLQLVGCTPEIPADLAEQVHLHGFLNKAQPADQVRLRQLLSESHLLVMPSRAEGFGVVYAEAAAYGLPVLAADVGGVSSAVKDNGILLPAEASAADYAAAVLALHQDPERYQQLAEAAYRRYREELNWTVFSQKILQQIRADSRL